MPTFSSPDPLALTAHGHGNATPHFLPDHGVTSPAVAVQRTDAHRSWKIALVLVDVGTIRIGLEAAQVKDEVTPLPMSTPAPREIASDLRFLRLNAHPLPRGAQPHPQTQTGGSVDGARESASPCVSACSGRLRPKPGRPRLSCLQSSLILQKSCETRPSSSVPDLQTAQSARRSGHPSPAPTRASRP